VVNADQKRLEGLLAEGREHDAREEACGKPEAKYGQTGKKQDHRKITFSARDIVVIY
jgi:hypothetical protein